MPLAFVFDDLQSAKDILSQLDKQSIAYQLREGDCQTELWVNDPHEALAVKQYCQKQLLNQQRSVNIKNLKAVPVTTGLLVLLLITDAPACTTKHTSCS